MRSTLLTLLLCVLCSCRSHQNAAPPQPAWYESEIQAFEQADAVNPPAPGQVLAIGSSSIRMWTGIGEDLAPAPVLNRGFGGSKTGEVLAVFDRIVTPYAPGVILYYCGDNDLGTDNTDAQSAADGFIAFDQRVRALWPEVDVFYIAIKPSMARWNNWAAMATANGIVRSYCETTSGAHYLDIATPMLTPRGPDPMLFRADGLHLNERGYEVWTAVIREPVVEAWQKRAARP